VQSKLSAEVACKAAACRVHREFSRCSVHARKVKQDEAKGIRPWATALLTDDVVLHVEQDAFVLLHEVDLREALAAPLRHLSVCSLLLQPPTGHVPR